MMMNRDSAIFLVFGLLIGFLGGYILHEEMAERQPPRLVHGGEGAPPAGARPGAGAGGAPAAGQQQAGMEAVQRLRQYVQDNPDDADAVLQLASLNYEIGNWPRARDLYLQFLELRPDSPDVLSDLGACYRETGEFQKALEAFDRAQTLQPDHWLSRFNEVIVLAFDLGDLNAAEEVLEELRRLQPDNPDVNRLAAAVEQRRGAA